MRIRHLFFIGLLTGLGVCLAAYCLGLILERPTRAQKELVANDARLLETTLNNYIREHGAYSEDLTGSLCLYTYQLRDFSPRPLPADISDFSIRPDPAPLQQLYRMESELTALRPYPSPNDGLGPLNLNIRLWLSPERTAQFKPHPEYWIVVRGDHAPLVYVDDNGWMTPEAMIAKLRAYRTDAIAANNPRLVQFLGDQIFYLEFAIITQNRQPSY